MDSNHANARLGNGLWIWLVVVGDEIVYANEAQLYYHSYSGLIDQKMIYVLSEALLCNPTCSLALIMLITRRMRSLVDKKMMDRCSEALTGRLHLQ